MAIHLEGTTDPERQEAERRGAAVQTILRTHRGRRVSQLSAAEQAQLLEAIAEHLGWADSTGIVR